MHNREAERAGRPALSGCHNAQCASVLGPLPPKGRAAALLRAPAPAAVVVNARRHTMAALAAAALSAAATAIAVPPHHHHHHHCIHDTLRKRTVVSPQRPSRRRLDTAALPGLRLVLNTETMVDDSRACTVAGQSVALGDPPSASTTCAGVGAGQSSDCHVCSTSDVLTAARRAILTDVLLPAVSAWFAAALRIRRPVQGPLVVKDEVCGFGGEVAIPAALLQHGSAATDVLIFVTTRPIASGTLAFAGHCQEDEGSGTPYVPRRPVVGHVNIDPAEIDAEIAPRGKGGELEPDEARVDAALKLLVHEVMHVLGFTHGKILEFPCPTRPGFNRHQVRGRARGRARARARARGRARARVRARAWPG